MLDLKHKKLDVWRMSVDFVTLVYKLTDNFPREESYGITSQLRRAAVSVVSNTSEGAARKSAIERKRFFEIARSSLVEIDTQIEISIRLGYCTKNDLTIMTEQINHIFAILSNLIQKTN